MFKGITFIINVFFLILFNLASSDISVQQSVPKRVETGNSFIVNVTIDKSTITGYAKYQVILPQGTTAEVIDGKNSKFSLDGNKMKFVWVNLPEESTLHISYKIVITDSSITEVSLSGAFAYLVDNERNTVNTATDRVAIGKVMVEEKIIPEPVVSVSRTITPIDDNNYLVTLNVSPENVVGFAKIQDQIPTGAIATSKNAHEAVFTQVSSKVKFVWMNFPENSGPFQVAYEISTPTAGTPEIHGEFAYLHEGESRKSPIEMTGQALASTTKTPSAPPAIKEDSTPQKTAVTATDASKTAPPPTPAPEVAKVPTPETGIFFKVQIMAGPNAVNTETYFQKKYSFTRQVGMDLHDGWHKYLTGEFISYVDARNLRNEITSNFSFRGPFVVAYNNGERITVQEALMATQQKWVN